MLDLISELQRSVGRTGDPALRTGTLNAKVAKMLAKYSAIIKYPVAAAGHATPLATVPTARVTYGAYVQLVPAATLNVDAELCGYLIVPSNTSDWGDFKIAKGAAASEQDIFFGHWSIGGNAQGAENFPSVFFEGIPLIGGARLACAVNGGNNGQGPGLSVYVGII